MKLPAGKLLNDDGPWTDLGVVMPARPDPTRITCSMLRRSSGSKQVDRPSVHYDNFWCQLAIDIDIFRGWDITALRLQADRITD